MKFFGRFRGLTVLIFLIIMLDLVFASSIAYLQLTSKSQPTPLSQNANALGRATHSLVIDQNGRLYASWIEKEVNESFIIFAWSVDFGREWNTEEAYKTPNSGIKPDERKLDNLSTVVDADGKAHISFMKNIRTSLGYGDRAHWSLMYITNRSGHWSPPEEIKGPWNSDWMGGIFRTAERRGYSEGVIGLRIDIDSDKVLHIASMHDHYTWWGWGGALYHHFKAEDYDWKTEEVGWQKVGIGDYEKLRLFYTLREKARNKDEELRELGFDDFDALFWRASEKIGWYRGDVGFQSHECWKNETANVDCYVQGQPLLFVSPENELYIFNSRLDNNLPYFQKIRSTEFWRDNELIHSEINPYNEPKARSIKCDEYDKVYNDNVLMKHGRLIKATFDSENNPHLCMISHDQKKIYYVKEMENPETAYESNFAIREAEIAMTKDFPYNDALHLLFIQEYPKNTRSLFHTLKDENGNWKKPTDFSPLGTKDYSELNLARYAGSSNNREYGLPFLGVTFKTKGRQLYFLRITDIPDYLALKALRNTLIFFGFSSAILFSIFVYSETRISRRITFDVKMTIKFLLVLIVFLIAKDIFSWRQRDSLFLARDPRTLIASLSGVLSTILFIISSYQRITKFLGKLFGLGSN